MIYGFDEDIVAALNTGDIVRVDTDKGEVEVIKKETRDANRCHHDQEAG